MKRARWIGLCLGLAAAHACSSGDGGSGSDASDGTDGGAGSSAGGSAGGGNVDASATGGSSGSAGAGGSGGGGGSSGSAGSGGPALTPVDGGSTSGPYQVPGGGTNSSPIQPGCGPETAGECQAPGGACSTQAQLPPDHDVTDQGSVCFYAPGAQRPSASVEYITEVLDGQEYVHIRIVFDPDFVDTVYGACAAESGWSDKGHTFRDLRGSDHVELLLSNCDDELSMHLRLDFIHDDANAPCGYATGGVTNGEGRVEVGDEAHVLAVATSLDRNMNGCGWCDDMESPCTDVTYKPSSELPEWDFRMVYEVWIDVDAFGASGFCTADIDQVHASPSKVADNTILVEPGDCPPPPNDCPPDYDLYLTSEGELVCAGPPNQDGGPPCPEGQTLSADGQLCVSPPNEDCPFDYDLFLTTEGEYVCSGPPTDGVCPEGYEVYVPSEGERCVPSGT